jgi:hypothetical protein
MENKILEKWNNFQNNEKSFEFTKEEVVQLNRSIAKIVSSAQAVLGAEGPTPSISHMLEKTTIEKQPEEIEMVAEEEDIEKLRQKYYGPKGDIKKHGPKAISKLKKGIGQTSAKEWEQTGYVLKISQKVLADFQNLVESIKQTGELYIQARDWYHNIRKLIDKETGSDRDAALLGLLIAIFSPQTKFAQNLAEAVFLFKAVQKDARTNADRLKQYIQTFPGAEKFEPGTFRGFQSNKVPNFALNIIAPQLAGYRDKEGKLIYNDMYMWNSTIDTWMIDAFYPMLKKASTAKEWEAIKGKLMSNVVSYRYMTQLVAQESSKMGILPHELQAIIWVAMQIRQTGDPGLGVITQFAFDQIKTSIINIRKINTELEDIKRELSNKSWLEILFSEIEQKGFEEAGKFLLGIKNEKGKQVVSGVRSIVAKGKKGDSFKYYQKPKEEENIKEGKEEGEEKGKKSFVDKTKAFADLYTSYVLNNLIQMLSGRFHNLHDAIMLYLDPGFSTEKAVSYLLGRFDPEALSTKEYFKEWVKRNLF